MTVAEPSIDSHEWIEHKLDDGERAHSSHVKQWEHSADHICDFGQS